MRPVRVRATSMLVETRDAAKEFILDCARKLLLSEEEEGTDPDDISKR